jgi:mRNA interferase RelE/StbE
VARSVELSKHAEKNIGKKVDAKDGEKVIEAIEALGDDPFPRGSKKIRREEGLFRIRVGDYRILYEVGKTRVLVVDVGKRKDIY